MKKYLLNSSSLVLFLAIVLIINLLKLVGGYTFADVYKISSIFLIPYINLFFIDYYYFNSENKKLKNILKILKIVLVIVISAFLVSYLYALNLFSEKVPKFLIGY